MCRDCRTKKSPALWNAISAPCVRVCFTPANNSKPIGRVYGIYMTASMTRPVYTVSFTLHLTAGPYNGSTIVMAGIDDDDMGVREHAVVGGTGALRGAEGYVFGIVKPFTSSYVVM